MAWPSQLVPQDGCGDAEGVGFLQNAAVVRGKLMLSTLWQNKDPVGIDIPNTFFAQGAFPEQVIIAHPGIEVSEHSFGVFDRTWSRDA